MVPRGGTSWQDAGITAAPARIGSTITALPAGPVGIVDRINSVDIAMLNAGMDLNDADMAALLRGENLALIGEEAIQFGSAVPLSPGRWRLSQLLRGRRGTEFAINGHQAGDQFVLLDAETLAPIDAAVGTSIAVMGTGIADPVPPIAMTNIIGNAVRPLSVCHLRAERLANGDVELRWVRRSRSGWGWPDGVDAPLGEEQELYELILLPDVGPARTHSLAVSAYSYSVAERAADLAAGATRVEAQVCQIGQLARSRPVSVSFVL